MRTARIAVDAIAALVLLLGACYASRAQAQRPRIKQDSVCGIIIPPILLNPGNDSMYMRVVITGRDTIDSVAWKHEDDEPIFTRVPVFLIYEDKVLKHVHRVPFHHPCPVRQEALLEPRPPGLLSYLCRTRLANSRARSKLIRRQYPFPEVPRAIPRVRASTRISPRCSARLLKRATQGEMLT